MRQTIAVIMVVLNDAHGAKLTLRSLKNQVVKPNQIIVIDGQSDEDTLAVIQQFDEIITDFVSEPDEGVYDAMNKGLDLVVSDLVHFLNAGDFIVGNSIYVNVRDRCLIPVKRFYKGMSLHSKFRNYRYSIPYSHQGMIFRRTKIRFALSYKIYADYDFVIRTGMCDLPAPPTSNTCYVHYQGGGLSERRFLRRDIEGVYIVFKHFGVSWAILTTVIAAIKSIVKFSLKPFER